LERILANPPDLILADVLMPRLDGLGLLERIRLDERTRTLPFIMLSARAGEEACVESLNAGADDYLIKPFSTRNLLARVRTHVEMIRLRRAAATALYESEKRFLELTDSAPVMIWLTDEHGNLEFANKTYLKYFEVALEDVAGQRWKDLFHPDDYESYSQQFLAASIARRSFRSEVRGRNGDGEWRWFDCWAVPRTTELGGSAGMVGCSVDITERKRAEERIRELAAIVESSDDAIFGVTMEGTITRWNKGAEKIYGYTEAEVIGQSISILIPAGRPDEVPRTLGRLERGEVIIREALRRRKDGQEIYVSLTISPIRNPAGQIIGSSTVARDVTERERVEQELRESEERFRELTENINEVFWLADPDLQWTIYASPAYEIIWGRTCASLCAKPSAWLDAIHPEDRFGVIEARKARSDVVCELEYRIVRPDSTVRWIRDRAFPVHDAGGRVIRMAGVAEDVTERRQLEMQLRQAQKMEAIGQLAGGVAHDFNNLLSVISGHSELLTMMSPSDERWHDSIAEIRRATEVGSAAIRQLLAFSCRQILEPQVLDLNAVVAGAKKMLRPLIGEDVRLATLLQPRISHVRADLGQLNQVILNLAINARDAMPQGGSLTLETREIDLDVADAMTHLYVRPSRYVLLTVTDTGWGMPANVQAHIFEPFFTNKAEGQGTGLGLSVVLGIIQQSGGHIDVESKPGVGTKFKIYLPAVQEPVEGPEQSASFKAVGGGETVLLVEDEEPVRNITTLLLENLGYRVLEAESGQEALRLFEASREKIDLLMTDVVMPDLSGRDVAEALRARNPGLKVLFQSGYTDDTVVRWGILHAEVDFLKKPFTLDVLARKVREVLDRT
jgi:two-component system, cell cycle sensor histidine kinase and response regulator CckA